MRQSAQGVPIDSAQSAQGVPMESASTRQGQNGGGSAPLHATIAALQEHIHSLPNGLEQEKSNAEWLLADRDRLKLENDQWWEEHTAREAAEVQQSLPAAAPGAACAHPPHTAPAPPVDTTGGPYISTAAASPSAPASQQPQQHVYSTHIPANHPRHLPLGVRGRPKSQSTPSQTFQR